jgi:serine/threonine-protein kinase
MPPGVLETNPEFDAMTMLGRVVGGRYRLEEVLGQGAMGAVYRGVQLALAKPYAIKVLLPSLTNDPQFVGRFQQEARIAAAIRHPGLVEVFDYGVEDGIAFYVMELLQGQTLSDYVGEDRVLAPEETVRIVAEAADAVTAAHDRGVIHRDLKPGNIFLARGDACRPLVKVLDFGVSKAAVFSAAAGAPTTMSGWVCGTPAFMSPEQTGRGVADGRSDIYSLGVVLYRLLSGKVPFQAAEAVVVMYQHLERPVPPLDLRPGHEVPRTLQDVVYRALAKRPKDRFGSMREFAQVLRASTEPRLEAGSGSSESLNVMAAPGLVAPEDSEARDREPSLVAGMSPNAADSGKPAHAPGVRRRWLAAALAGIAACAIGAGGVIAQRLAHPSRLAEASFLSELKPLPEGSSAVAIPTSAIEQPQPKNQATTLEVGDGELKDVQEAPEVKTPGKPAVPAVRPLPNAITPAKIARRRS